mmetsp:Transcript_4418/g.12826  ORF Transcript_4418/g.12826 Transcript_4418/m.12826 type:complete len:202 (+) Transcript_4418:391-996(+)
MGATGVGVPRPPRGCTTGIWKRGYMTGYMTGVFWVLKDSMRRWSHCKSRTVLFDTKHGTKAHDFKLGCFCIVDGNGKIHVIAACLVHVEKHEAFECAFQRFREYFHGDPLVIFSGGAAVRARCAGACSHLVRRGAREGAGSACDVLQHRGTALPARSPSAREAVEGEVHPSAWLPALPALVRHRRARQALQPAVGQRPHRG